MGSKYTVCAFGKHDGFDGPYSNRQMWAGNWFFIAEWNLRKAKLKGFSCVTLEWRS